MVYIGIGQYEMKPVKHEAFWVRLGTLVCLACRQEKDLVLFDLILNSSNFNVKAFVSDENEDPIVCLSLEMFPPSCLGVANTTPREMN